MTQKHCVPMGRVDLTLDILKVGGVFSICKTEDSREKVPVVDKSVGDPTPNLI